jgi:hypothetical protein
MPFSNARSITVAGGDSISRAQTAGNRQKFTISAWVKRGSVGSVQTFAGFGSTSGPVFDLAVSFLASNTVVAQAWGANGASILALTSTEVVSDTTTLLGG